jgi:UDP-N-acetylmuramoyl-L-alanyl-D-glutamate--2,6-diaminopimelate ligase
MRGVELLAPLAANPEISGLAYHSAKVQPGNVFFAIHGAKSDGNLYIEDALARGAAAVVSEKEISATLPWVQARNARQALAQAAANFYGHPGDALTLVGVTGTNGKTTTTFLLDSVLRAAGHRTGMFGTIEYRTPASSSPAQTTTPESLDLQRFLAEVRAAGGTHVVLEASSHGLALDRLFGLKSTAAVFTNLTRDHLDFHGDMQAYFDAKKKLFAGVGAGPASIGVVNADDAWASQLMSAGAERIVTYGIKSRAEVNTKKFQLSFRGLEFVAETPGGAIPVRSSLVGRNNVYNILAAIATAVALGVEREAIEKGITALEAVPGRFERLEEGQPFAVIVDYAHTDDALRNLLETGRELRSAAAGSKTPGRIITVFGCGGDRDRSKRPLMGEAAGTLSDLCILTNDNPRNEDPLMIINDALVGLQKVRANYRIEPDRAKAIELALEMAAAGDIVFLAGKGHEATQVLAARVVPFRDQEVARAVLRKLGYGRTAANLGRMPTSREGSSRN